VSAKRRLRVAIACRADSDVVCAGRVRLRATGRPGLGFGSRRYSVRGGSRRRVSVRVPRGSLALLRRWGSRRVAADLIPRGSRKGVYRAVLRVRAPSRRG
jgi:hypothetical protein